MKEVGAIDAAALMRYASTVIVVPGYGMAVAHAQHKVWRWRSYWKRSRGHGEIRHPPRRRTHARAHECPLAEAGVPYDKIFDLDEINGEFAQADVALVIGANDVVNPVARTDKSSPIYGMPIPNADQAQNVIVVKRGKGTRYSGVENAAVLHGQLPHALRRCPAGHRRGDPAAQGPGLRYFSRQFVFPQEEDVFVAGPGFQPGEGEIGERRPRRCPDVTDLDHEQAAGIQVAAGGRRMRVKSRPSSPEPRATPVRGGIRPAGRPSHPRRADSGSGRGGRPDRQRRRSAPDARSRAVVGDIAAGDREGVGGDVRGVQLGPEGQGGDQREAAGAGAWVENSRDRVGIFDPGARLVEELGDERAQDDDPFVHVEMVSPSQASWVR